MKYIPSVPFSHLKLQMRKICLALDKYLECGTRQEHLEIMLN